MYINVCVICIVIETQNSKAKGLCFIPVEQQMLRNIKSTVSDFFLFLSTTNIWAHFPMFHAFQSEF